MKQKKVRRLPFASRAAFTLIEMLVALAVFSIIAVSISAVFRTGVRTWRAGNEWSEENQTARNFFRQISKELENSVDYAPEMPLDGTEKDISFMTIVDTPDALQGSLRELKRVVYRYDADAKAVKRFQAGKEDGFEIRDSKEEPVADHIESMSFGYAFKAVYGGDPYHWKSQWKDQKGLPRGVRIRLGDFQTVIFIPTGSLGDESALIQ